MKKLYADSTNFLPDKKFAVFGKIRHMFAFHKQLVNRAVRASDEIIETGGKRVFKFSHPLSLFIERQRFWLFAFLRRFTFD